MGLAVLAAVAAVGWRRWQSRREETTRPGASLRRAIRVRSFEQIDRIACRRRCRCGDPLHATGEGSSQLGDRRFRVLTLECSGCGKERRLYFDVTRIFH